MKFSIKDLFSNCDQTVWKLCSEHVLQWAIVQFFNILAEFTFL